MVELFGFSVAIGFSLTMIVWFAVWGATKVIGIFKQITKV
jgi:hypothetical protein